jgi:hypothetical protein
MSAVTEPSWTAASGGTGAASKEPDAVVESEERTPCRILSRGGFFAREGFTVQAADFSPAAHTPGGLKRGSAPPRPAAVRFCGGARRVPANRRVQVEQRAPFLWQMAP